MPGAGKTIITSIVVKHLWTRFQSSATVGIAYVYCDFRRQNEQKPVDLLSSLLKQLVQEQPSIPKSLKSLYKGHKKKRTRPLFEEISTELLSVVANYPKVFIIIDALDEYHNSDGGRRRFLSEIFKLQAKTKLNLFATSRFNPEIERDFKDAILVEIRASDEDMRRYLEGKMIQLLPQFVLESPDLREEIKTAIIKAVDGMYVSCYDI